MAVSKIVCPECGKVLRPIKPVAVGKSVTCPRCSAKFRVEEPEEEEDLDEPKKPKKESKSREKPQKQEKNKAKKSIPIKNNNLDDEDGAGTYGLIQEGEDEEKEKISYAPDTSVKDLRGPAQEVIVQPTNLMIMVAALGFFGWLAFIVTLLIPTLLPLRDEEGRPNMQKKVLEIGRGLGTPERSNNKDFATLPENELKSSLETQTKTAESEKKKATKADPDEFRVLVLFDQNLAWIANLDPLGQLAIFVPMVVAMLYCAFIMMGTVSAQNLESRSMGIVAAAMAIIPITILGIGSVLAMLIGFLALMVLDSETVIYVQIGIYVICFLLCLYVAVWNIKVLTQDFVIAGFEYVPDE